MRTTYLRDQRGVAMLLELVLVAAVLSLVGIALYQSNHHVNDTAALVNKPGAVSAEAAADTAAKAVEQDVINDKSLDDATNASATELSATDDDLSNLGGSFDDSNF